MFKMIIVDDEKRARDLVAKYIEKISIDFEVVGLFSNGEEALSYLNVNKVDLVITDIKMPYMDGISLAKKIYETMNDSKVMIISAYDEFSYAKKAIEYNVINFIVKPIDISELEKTLKILSTQLYQKETQINQIDDTNSNLKEQFINELCLGSIKSEDVGNNFGKLGFSFEFSKSNGFFLEISIKNLNDFLTKMWAYGKEKISIVLLNAMQKNFSEKNIYQLYSNKEKYGFVIILADNKYEVQSKINKMINDLKTMVNLEIEISKISEFDNVADLRNIVYLKNSERDIIKTVISHIKDKKFQEAKSILKELFKEQEGNGIADFTTRVYIAFNNAQILEKQPKVIIKSENDSVEEFIENTINELFLAIRKDSQKGDDLIIKKAKDYINENCHKDISREDVAEYIYLSSSYFSRYFKQQTGESFYDYLIGVRMRKAVEMLLENYKIYEIMEKVGYVSRKHFNKIFKNYTGYAPIEYKKYVLKTEVFDDEEDK